MLRKIYKQKKVLFIFFAVVIVCLVALISMQQNNNSSKIQSPVTQNLTPTPSFDTTKYVAMVNGIGIERSIFEKRNSEREHLNAWLASHKTTSTSVETSVIDTLINQSLAYEFGKKNNLIPSDKEIEAKYLQAVRSVGSEITYLSKIKEIQGIEKDEILEQLKFEILQTKIENLTKLPFTSWLIQQKAKSDIKKSNNI